MHVAVIGLEDLAGPVPPASVEGIEASLPDLVLNRAVQAARIGVRSR